MINTALYRNDMKQAAIIPQTPNIRNLRGRNAYRMLPTMLTMYSRALEKLTVVQLVMKCPASSENDVLQRREMDSMLILASL